MTFTSLGAPHPATPHHRVSTWRWAAALVLGILLWGVGLFASELVPQVVLGLELEGATYALVGVIRAVLGLAAVALALRVVGLRLPDVGLVTTRLGDDVALGAAIAVGFALLQFLVIIPSTGGATRSDIVANAAQIGESPWGVAGFIVLAWTGALSEEVFFRGHFVTTLRNLLGGSTVAVVTTVIATVLLFAAGHGYQGWAGVVDTGLFGGLALTLLYLWRRRLTACIVAHALWNTLATIGIYLWY